MLRFHKEGTATILLTLLVVGGLSAVVWLALPILWLQLLLSAVLLFLLWFFLQFFRNPVRRIAVADDGIIYAPADGKIVVIEEAEETEFFKGRRLQVSIFMSPLNVHVNRNPISGLVRYSRYHAGKYLAAWHPKSSTENERTTIVFERADGKQILMRQIAGALARRIVNYLKDGDKVVQGEDMGFIKLGSRVDLFLPLDAQIKVKIGDMVQGNLSTIATF